MLMVMDAHGENKMVVENHSFLTRSLVTLNARLSRARTKTKKNALGKMVEIFRMTFFKKKEVN
jgi:hypothetical protein